MSQEEFFKKHKDYSVMASFFECRRDFSIEELYQAFKQRLITEVVGKLPTAYSEIVQIVPLEELPEQVNEQQS